MTMNVGENVGAYRIVEQLGQGGMATVFKAYHAALDRYVAIKVMHPAFKEDPTFLARFQREARVVAKLEHPNVVPVYDYAEHNGAPYLVMKFVEGETLKAKLARGPISLAEAVKLIDAVGAGLDYAHRQGILHRDIKPSNVMLASDGNTYLADFGLARIAQAGESTLSSDSLLGTPHYMSPEQAKGVKELDAGTDIYSLGVVMYELVVGRLPYSADTPFAIIHDHIYTPLPMPHVVNPNVPEPIERVLLKALAKERADRYPDVAALAAAFRDAAAGAAPSLTALPHAAPVSPSIVTPTAATVKGAAPEVATADRVASAPAAKKGYKFRWWHALVGVVLVGCCCFAFIAVAGAPDRQARQATQAAAASAQATAPPLATDTPLPGATDTPMPHVTDTPHAPPSPAADAKTLLAEAEKAYRESRPKDALDFLNQAVAVNPADLGVWLIAGDMTLSTGLVLDALTLYYLPGVEHTQPPFEPTAMELRGHAALAFYILAVAPDAADFLKLQLDTYPDPIAPRMALLRHNVFYNQPDAALREIQAVLQEDPGNPGALLIAGDYYLKAGQPGQAALRYKAAQDVNQPAPLWVRMEAACGAKKAVEQGASAKLEPTCEPLSSLLTGR